MATPRSQGGGQPSPCVFFLWFHLFLLSTQICNPLMSSVQTKPIPIIVSRPLLLGLAVAILAGAGFLLLAHGVLNDQFTSLNHHLLLAIHAHQSPLLTAVARALSFIGSAVGITLLGGAVCVVWIRKRRSVDAWMIGVLLVGCALITEAMKHIYQQSRPQVFPPLEAIFNFSFPSGHTLTSFSFALFVSVLMLRRGRPTLQRWCAALGLLATALLIATSRMYLGVHWPTDVAAGILVAAIWTSACLMTRRWVLTRRMRRQSRYS